METVMIQWMAARKAASMWWPALVGAAVIAGPIFMLGQCSGVEIQKNRQASAQVSDITKNSAAREAAAGERARDDAAVDQLERNLSDAAKASPDARPSDGMRSFDCQRLLNAGINAPECRRPGG